MTKIPKFSNFQSFYAFFVRFSTDFVDSNVLMVQQGNFGCPVVFCEEFIAVFQVKMSQNVKNFENSTLQSFHAFSPIFDGLCGLER